MQESSRRDFIKATVATGLLGSVAGCARLPSGSGLQGLGQDQSSILSNSSWQSSNADIGNTRVNQQGEPRAGVSTPEWTQDVDVAPNDVTDTVYEPVVDGRGNVFLAGPDPAVHCHDFESGAEKWSVELPGVPAGAPAFDSIDAAFRSNQLLYVTTVNGYVVAVNPNAGETVFETRVSGSCSTGPTAAAEACYAYVDDPGRLVAVDISGEVVWEVGKFNNSPTHPPAIGDELLYVQTGRGLLGIAPDSYTDDPGVAITIPSTARTPPVVENDTLYYADGRGIIHRYDVEVTSDTPFGSSAEVAAEESGLSSDEEDGASSEHVFRSELESPATGELAVDSQNVYCLMKNGSIEAITKNDGSFTWRTDTDRDEAFVSMSVSGTVIYVTGDSGGLYVVSTINGAILNQYSVNTPFDTSLTPVEDSLLMATSGEPVNLAANKSESNSGGSDSVSSEEAQQLLTSLQTELTAEPLEPRFTQVLSRAHAVDEISVTHEPIEEISSTNELFDDPTVDTQAIFRKNMQAGALTSNLINQFETGVKNGDVGITDADAALQKLLASLAASGEFMLTFSADSEWPSGDDIDGIETHPGNGIPFNQAREDGVGFQMCRSFLAIPFHAYLTFGGGKVMKFLNKKTGSLTDDLGPAARTAVNRLLEKLKGRGGIEALKEFMGGNSILSRVGFRVLNTFTTIVRRLLVNGPRGAREAIRSSDLDQFWKDFLIDNFFSTKAIGAFLTDRGGKMVTDMTGIDELIKELFDTFGRLLNSQLQAVIEAEIAPNIEPSENSSDTGFVDRRVTDYVQDMTSDERYAEASHGSVETNPITINTELANVISEYSSIGTQYYEAIDFVDDWDSRLGIPSGVVELTQKMHSDNEEESSSGGFLATLAGTGWEFLSGFLTFLEEAAKAGLGMPQVARLLLAHDRGVRTIQSL